MRERSSFFPESKLKGCKHSSNNTLSSKIEHCLVVFIFHLQQVAYKVIQQLAFHLLSLPLLKYKSNQILFFCSISATKEVFHRTYYALVSFLYFC